MGEQWRERTEHRELAEEALRRFRTEIVLNRDAVASRKDYHATLMQELTTYFASSTIYGQSWTQDIESVFRSILNYLGDVSYFDPVMLKAYNEVLVQIDRALGESPSGDLR